MASNIHSNNNSTVNGFHGNRNGKSFFFSYVREEDVHHVVDHLGNKTETNCSNISMVLLKKCLESIIKPVAHINNKSIEFGIFPDRMKIAKVLAVFKAGNKSQFNNYRSMAILPPFSTIFEKLLERRLDSFLKKYNIINES